MAPKEQFLPVFTILCYLLLHFHVKTRTRFSLRDEQLFEISEVEITRVDYIYIYIYIKLNNRGPERRHSMRYHPV